MGVIEDYYYAHRVEVSTRAASYFGRCRCFGATVGPHECPALFTDGMDRWSLAYLRMVWGERTMEEPCPPSMNSLR
jgi:hypothetical protein